LSVGIYMDVHIPYPITRGLRLRGVDVLTAQEDGARELDDPQLLDRATDLGRILFTQDQDLLHEAQSRRQAGVTFGGVIYVAQLRVTFRQCIDDLELVAKCTECAEWSNRLDYLPLKGP
jgi:predicted nuclease of predicted toxin-antitoxin system